ncbi:hypothetical protein HW555_003461 [Spodoptera exigua]|uniref:DDE Tnp4 domain-containing protein n=1 Tax=Spodoptera exigua TaxID=7107 RepID=A0A835GLC7_SPOEX|nr:hypothetical protein HW555_003461 [Spodoptera exigua]
MSIILLCIICVIYCANACMRATGAHAHATTGNAVSRYAPADISPTILFRNNVNSLTRMSPSTFVLRLFPSGVSSCPLPAGSEWASDVDCPLPTGVRFTKAKHLYNREIIVETSDENLSLKLRGRSATTMSTARHRTKIWFRMYEKRYSETQNILAFNDNGAFALDFTCQSVKLMAVRLSCMIFLLEEAKRRDNVEKRRQAHVIRNMDLITTDTEFIKVFRLTEELIKQLEEDISPFLAKTKRKGGICNRTKILCTLAFLASGSYQKILCENARTYISQASASRAIRAVVNAINHPAIINKYIRFPQNTNERQILKEKFYEKFKMPGTIGCVDGTLVSMVRPKEHEERYYCRKGYHARNAVIINDPDLNIMHVDVTFGGATHDSFIFNNSVIKTHLEQLNNTGETVYLLGINPGPGSKEEYYNDLHATARNTAERTIGILKGRFRCLLVHRVLHYDPEMVGKIIKACCVLHNICNQARVPPVELPAHLQRQEASVIRLLQQGSQNSISDLDSGRLVRGHLIDRLWRGQNS